MSGYLTKPVRRRRLLEALHGALFGQPETIAGRPESAASDTAAPNAATTGGLPPSRNRTLAQDSPAADAPRVLLVEDNAVNQKLACLLLKSFGYAVDLAGDGQQALDAHSRTPYAAALLLRS